MSGVGQLPGDLAAEVKDLVLQQTDQAKAQIITETRAAAWKAGVIGGVVGGAVGLGLSWLLFGRRRR